MNKKQKREEDMLLEMVLSSKDARCQALIEKFGPKGYGIYLMLASKLISAPLHKLSLDDIAALASSFKVSEAKILDTVKNYKLFTISAGFFYIEGMVNSRHTNEH